MKVMYIASILMVTLLSNACKKFVTIDPPIDQVVNPEPFTNDASATSTITGIYSEMMNNAGQFSTASTTFYAGMYADELYYYSPGVQDEFVAGDLSQVSHDVINSNFWQPMYKYIYAANLALEQLRLSTMLTAPVKQRLTGEALFIRVFCYHYLTNLFGDVPLVLGSAYTENMSLPRTPQAAVLARMSQDIATAIELLPDDYPEGDRTRPNKWSAKALQSRMALYAKDYTKAASVAGELINNNLFVLEADCKNSFLKASKEAIWQLQPVRPSYNTTEGNLILPASNATQPSYLVTSYLLNAFQVGDKRKDGWLNARVYNNRTLYYPYKYKIRMNQTVFEFYVVERLAEQYLIRAEANTRLGNIAEAIQDINAIRTRAGLPPTTASDEQSLISAIEQERRIELCFEWGHRWFDLKRTRQTDVLAPIKTDWSAKDTLWPIPIRQINLNPALTQNSGY
ncbi:RagB/SusD family nutrient uptake outer membrane protein [Pinibacter aurantiacus]|uniref:RagB/SusD family nutrient uptake outer membrane protein n=1 Tax=Pinibacter aurantiacus TaxID=2851599 RepID=A0A9E2S939_9BACT|nr:RagB/SusD family nutrient uptake outer membrane protein [Pinibacter aurantiacus]MBV4358778.1 RagB/SusD family nutrient uptake outer membrane protein [Pinibacter aurantiacus]